MSGMYNLLFGYNPLAQELLEFINVDPNTVDRFRDCFLSKDGTEIIIYTRTGGSNRPDYEDSNARLRAKTGYLRDEDDSFDNTYALFRFSIPDGSRELCLKLAEAHGVDPAKRWEETLGKMRA